MYFAIPVIKAAEGTILLHYWFFFFFCSLLQGLLDVSDKFIYDQLIGGKEDDSTYKRYVLFLF